MDEEHKQSIRYRLRTIRHLQYLILIFLGVIIGLLLRLSF